VGFRRDGGAPDRFGRRPNPWEPPLDWGSVPTFCRHNRLEANCPICSRNSGGAVTPSRPARRPESRAVSTPSKRRPSSRAAGDLRVRRMARAADDGYENDLLPGLRATVEAAHLADELAFSAARLDQLRTAPRGLYADVVTLDDPEEQAWLLFQIAYIGPREGEDPFAEIDRVRTTWASGDLPDVDSVEVGPRTAHDPARGTRTLEAYRAWAERAGSQAAGLGGDSAWTPQRRFERAFERLAIRGFGRGPRYELLVLLGALGVFDMRPWSLHLSDAMDPTTIAAKRVFGIGDAMNLQRRASDLAATLGLPMETLDLALLNWSRGEGERITAGAQDLAWDDRAADLRRQLRAEPAGEPEPA
jgi:alpha-glutamyl/putrescinyl thymine pyrophosphorylase-like protein